MKQEHEYAQVLRWVADGERVEGKSSNAEWVLLDAADVLRDIADCLHISYFRLAPRTITVNGREVPEPVKVKPYVGVHCFVACIDTPEFYNNYTWTNHVFDYLLLQRGLIHLTKEAAIAHAKAMLGVDE